ncbi:MAG: GNAT family N-acetyltransferase [Microcoleaceae cyanobacterium]
MIIIKPFSPAYQDQVIDLILTIQRDEFSIPIQLSDQPDLLDIPKFYQQKNGNFWIAIDRHTPEGTLRECVIGTIALIDIGASQGTLRKMFVLPEYRGSTQGVGKKLLETLINWSQQKGLNSIYLGTTEQFKAAHRFYKKNGFIEIKKNQLPAQFPIMAVDTKFYCLTLSKPTISLYNMLNGC